VKVFEPTHVTYDRSCLKRPRESSSRRSLSIPKTATKHARFWQRAGEPVVSKKRRRHQVMVLCFVYPCVRRSASTTQRKIHLIRLASPSLRDEQVYLLKTMVESAAGANRQILRILALCRVRFSKGRWLRLVETTVKKARNCDDLC
jgi:hypothetical protein